MEPKTIAHEYAEVLETLGTCSPSLSQAKSRPHAPNSLSPSWAGDSAGQDSIRVVPNKLAWPSRPAQPDGLVKQGFHSDKARSGHANKAWACSCELNSPNGLLTWAKSLLLSQKLDRALYCPIRRVKCTQADFMTLGPARTLFGLWAWVLDNKSDLLTPKFLHTRLYAFGFRV